MADKKEVFKELLKHMYRVNPKARGDLSNCITVGEGWYGIILEAHELLLKIDLNYEMRYIKEKYAVMELWANPSENTDVLFRKMNQVSDWARDVSATTCELCGAKESHMCKIDDWEKIYCDKCIDALIATKGLVEEPRPRTRILHTSRLNS